MYTIMTSSLSIARRPGELDPGQLERRLAVDPLASPESFKRQAYTALKNAIAAMDVYRSRTDIRLDERRLAQDFGISRTPVREAMAQLEREGFVRSVPRRGVYVVRKTRREVIELITARETRRELMERAAVSSDGTSGSPPVSSVESVRANRATWYLSQILPKTGNLMRNPSMKSRPFSVCEKRYPPNPVPAKMSRIHSRLWFKNLPKARRSMVIAGSFEPIWSYNVANCGITKTNMKNIRQQTSAISTQG